MFGVIISKFKCLWKDGRCTVYFKELHDWLIVPHAENAIAMAGFILKNTLSDNGGVTRGVCKVEDGHTHIVDVVETSNIVKTVNSDGKIGAEADRVVLNPDSYVSMNMWGFSASILRELKDRFPLFLKENVEKNPLKCEYFLPFVVDELLGEKKATVKVLKSMDKWYGVTYKEDKPVVVAAIQKLKDDGLYPQKLWEEK